MTLRLTNTFSGAKEAFAPLDTNRVGLYVCGVTVYDDCHIGHARAAVAFDTLVRYLRHRGFHLTYVRNFTDIDDKILNRAAQEGVDWTQISRRYVEAYYRDMNPLGLVRPDVEPRATDHIPDMLQLIERLVEKGYAYAAGGNVFFAIEKFPAYGRLSGKNIDELIAGARVEPSEEKRNPLDFALWKAAKPGEPSWPSPWGPGRPGWHIECSAMSMKYLGESFDLHGGGRDLIFPHHENEIAQSEAATGRPFARMFIHNGFVNIRSEKMSKSEGNIIALKDIYRHFTPEALRLYLLSTHYASPLDYSDDNLRQAEQRTFRVYKLLSTVRPDLSPPPDALDAELTRFNDVMDDDLNTPAALALIAGRFDALASDLHATGRPRPLDAIALARAAILAMGAPLGLFQADPQDYFARVTQLHLTQIGLTAAAIEERIAERTQARSAKDWARADRIRADLKAQGVALEDAKDRTTWRVDL
ncbi:MAG: cysteine--tRNA ligase [Nitrospirae bacterium]|nr:cysteine--tRNA ligase [Nitrospirota bacterium]